MDDNPYRSPEMSPAYYTDDITLLPITAIWRMVRRQPLLVGLLYLPYLLLRKALNLRYPANHGVSRTEKLELVDDGQLPQVVCDAFAPYEEVLRAQGMDFLGSFRSPWIGNRTGFVSIWLDRTGKTYVTVAWIHIRLGDIQNTNTVFACHSQLTSGVELHTGPVAPQNWMPEIIPPNQDLLRLEPDVQPLYVIERHAERIANRSDVIQFDEHSVLEQVVCSARERFDFMVQKGFYSQLSESEVERLMSVGDLVESVGVESG